MRKGKMLWAMGLALAMPTLAVAQEARYLQPPEPLLQVFRAPLNPSPALDPTGTRAILIRQSQYPPIARVAEPYLKLAGVRVEPRNHSRHDRSNGYGIRTCLESFSVLELASGKETTVALPAGACPGTPSWSPDGTRLLFVAELDSARGGIYSIPRLGGSMKLVTSRFAPFDVHGTADSIAAMRQFGIADMVEKQFRGQLGGLAGGLKGGVQ